MARKSTNSQTIHAYLAGPDVFLHDPRTHGRRKVEICAAHGVTGHTPLDDDVDMREMTPPEAGGAIYRHNIQLMRRCDIIIANLSPFRGPSADVGTVFELGMFVGMRRPSFGYSNSGSPFAERTREFLGRYPDPIDLTVEDFDLPDNLMIPSAVLQGGRMPMLTSQAGHDAPLSDLAIFEELVTHVSRICAPLARLRALATDMLQDEEQVTRFLHDPHPLLDDHTPAEAVMSDPSREEGLSRILLRLQHGIAV